MADKGDSPLAGRFLFDRGGLDVSFHSTMQDNRDKSRLGNGDTIAFQMHSLRDTKGVGSALLALWSWEPCTTLEEVLVGGAKIAQDLLQCLGIAFVEEGEVGLLLEDGKFFTHLGKGERFARL